jgi:hypothetical protein
VRPRGQGALDLAGEQVGVGAEVALERVLEDHDPVRGEVASDGRAVVLLSLAVLASGLALGGSA